MKFHKLEKKYAVMSDNGIMVDRTGSPFTQFTMRYHENGKIIEYPLENLISSAKIPIFTSLITHWNPPYSDELLPQSKRLQIAEYISAAINFLGDKSYVIQQKLNLAEVKSHCNKINF